MNLASSRDHEAAVTKRVLLSLAVFLLTLNLSPSVAGGGTADGQARPVQGFQPVR